MKLGHHHHSDHSSGFHATMCCPTGSFPSSYGPEFLRTSLASASACQCPHTASVQELTPKVHCGKEFKILWCQSFFLEDVRSCIYPRLPLTWAQGTPFSVSQGRNLKWAQGLPSGQASSGFSLGEVRGERKPDCE